MISKANKYWPGIILLAIVSCISTTLFAFLPAGCQTIHSSTGSLKVNVVSEDNGPLWGAKVISEIEPEGQSKVTGITGNDGSVIYSGIEAGNYSFYVSRFDYENVMFDVSVRSSHLTEITITLLQSSAG